MIKKDVIGYGYWGPDLARNIDQFDCRELTVVADFDADKRTRAQRPYSYVDAGADDAALNARDDLDVVTIATPLASHFDRMLAAPRSGEHTIVEKPATASSGSGPPVEVRGGRARSGKGGRPVLHQFDANRSGSVSARHERDLQSACGGLGYGEGNFPMAEALAREFLSLPLFPTMSEARMSRVLATLQQIVGAKASVS